MQIVIDIPENTYKQIQALSRSGYFEHDICGNSMRRIANGTPLPKGHGRIGDLDALRKEVSSWGMNDYEPSDFIDEIDRADVIIKAERSESE